MYYIHRLDEAGNRFRGSPLPPPFELRPSFRDNARNGTSKTGQLSVALSYKKHGQTSLAPEANNLRTTCARFEVPARGLLGCNARRPRA